MLAVTVTPGGSPALRELPSPTAPPGGVLVRVRACGLCGSDVEKLRPGGAVVAGAGSIGLLAAQALRARGSHARVMDPDPERARRAAEAGFPAPAAGERFSGALVTAPAALPAVLGLLEPGGTVVLFSG